VAKGVQYGATAASRGVDRALEALEVSANKKAESLATKPLPWEDPRAGDWLGKNPQPRVFEDIPGGGQRVSVVTEGTGGRQGAANVMAEIFDRPFDPNEYVEVYRGTQKFTYNPRFNEIRVDYNEYQTEFMKFGK
jgi:hypothetical protein